MTKPNKAATLDGGGASGFGFLVHRPAASEPQRYVSVPTP